MFPVEATCPSQERMSAQGPSAAIRNVSPEGLESRGDPVIRSIAREQMPSSLEMACFGGSNRCAHRWKQRQTSPEKPVGTSVGIGAPGSAENTRKMAFGEIVSPVGPTSSFVAAAQRRGSCQTHHRACSKSSSWKSACRSDQNSSSPVPFNAPARPFERPISGTPHARRATRTRSRRSCCARPALSSRDRLSDDCWRHQRSQ